MNKAQTICDFSWTSSIVPACPTSSSSGLWGEKHLLECLDCAVIATAAINIYREKVTSFSVSDVLKRIRLPTLHKQSKTQCVGGVGLRVKDSKYYKAF